MSKNDNVTKPITLDLDAIGKNSSKLSAVVDAQITAEQKAKEALTYYASPEYYSGTIH